MGLRWAIRHGIPQILHGMINLRYEHASLEHAAKILKFCNFLFVVLPDTSPGARKLHTSERRQPMHHAQPSFPYEMISFVARK